MDSNLGRGASAPAAKASKRGSMMSKFPTVWIANQVYSYTVGPLLSRFGSWVLRYTLRTPQTGAMAVFHVSTLLDLGDEENGGGLFADTSGAFVECGREL